MAHLSEPFIAEDISPIDWMHLQSVFLFRDKETILLYQKGEKKYIKE